MPTSAPAQPRVKRIFASFDFRSDHDLKGSLVGQIKDLGLPFRVDDVSLNEAQPDQEWRKKAEAAVREADVFVVLLGLNTHQASGVLEEVQMARRHKKYRFQLKPQDRKSTPIPGAGPSINWTKDKLGRALRGVVG